MIQNTETAKRILAALEETCRQLRETLPIVQEDCSESEYKAYSREVAQISGRIFYLIMDPIYCQHPDLAPPEAPPKMVEH
jgi:hypothetical protein